MYGGKIEVSLMLFYINEIFVYVMITMKMRTMTFVLYLKLGHHFIVPE